MVLYRINVFHCGTDFRLHIRRVHNPGGKFSADVKIFGFVADIANIRIICRKTIFWNDYNLSVSAILHSQLRQDGVYHV